MGAMAAERPDFDALRERDDWPRLPYWMRLRRLRQAHGWTQLQLRDKVTPDLEYDHVRALELEPGDEPARGGKRPRWRYPTPQALEVLAAALGVQPDEFPEYRLARAREELDERVVGLDDALDHLDRTISALRQQAVRRRATEGVRRERRRQELPSNPDEAASGEGA